MKADFITSESLQALNDKVDKLSAEIMQVIGHRLTSLSLIPTDHINGIAAITLTTLQYTPQVYKPMAKREQTNILTVPYWITLQLEKFVIFLQKRMRHISM